jgi:hypothetical protein
VSGSFYLKLFAALILLSSCSTLYYAPSQPVLPMVTEKKVTKIGGSIGAGENSSAYELNGFYSVSNHLGLVANLAVIELDLNELWQGDIGAGYFTPVSENWGLESYATVGYGSLRVSNYYWQTSAFDKYIAEGVLRCAVQPDVFFHTANFEAGAGFRMQFFSFDELPFDPEFVRTTKNHVMLEPTLRLAVGWPGFKLSLQGTASEKLNSGHLNYDEYMVSLGVVVMLKSKKP